MHVHDVIKRLTATAPGSNGLVYIYCAVIIKYLRSRTKKKSKLAKMMGIIFSVYLQLKVAQVLYYTFFTTYCDK